MKKTIRGNQEGSLSDSCRRGIKPTELWTKVDGLGLTKRARVAGNYFVPQDVSLEDLNTCFVTLGSRALGGRGISPMRDGSTISDVPHQVVFASRGEAL